MQKWEYLDVYVDREVAKVTAYKVRLVNGQELPNWSKGPHYIQYLNTLGQQGWELLSVWGTAGGTIELFHFKRPKP